MRTFGHRGRTPHGVRELKLWAKVQIIRQTCRTPHGVRELKLEKSPPPPEGRQVAPHTGCVN